jgi:hypothetical protein
MHDEYSEVVTTSEDGKFRVKIVQDQDAQMPDWYGMVPVMQIDTGYYGSVKATAFNEHAQPYVDAFNRLSDLGNGNGYSYEVFERYMRIFHGTVAVDSYNVGVIREYGYVAFDTAAWREEMGCSEEQMKEEERKGDLLHDIQAWAEGDVWGIVIEKLVSWSTEDEDFDDFNDWEEVRDESVWGYYGQEYAEESAKEMLESYLERFSKK